MASAPNASGMEFEVFLSFRGSDTRDNFTSCLYHFMIEKGIRVFKDDKELQVGEKIDELFKALDDSQIYIPIFSEDFASSAWCLCEVARMVDRTLESDGKKEILPLFFDVTPEDVKSSTGLYSNALSKLEKEKVKSGHEEEKEKYDPDEVKRWRDALREVATRAGWKREGREYGELIGSIVREVQLKLKVKNRDLPDHLVKVDDEEVIEELLDVDSDGVRFVIIHGMGGIGKSTLAKVIFNKFLYKFSYSSFLEDVQSHRLLDMQKKLLSDTLGVTSAYGIHDTNDGINCIRKGLSEKKVMVVVDNVNNKEQLKNIAGSYKWFGSGSRIIITVRDKRTIPYRMMLDEDNQTGSSYYRYHQVEEMPPDRAIKLFSKHAFGSDTPPKDWNNFSVEVVSSIGRLPLTLEVVGSLFATTDRSEWHETFKDLEQVPCEEVRKTLMISLNKLDLRKREIFLDIACFCIGKDKTHAYHMWDDCGYSPRRAIDDLLLMSLIKIDKYNEFWMHDEIRDLGRYIVKEENLGDARKRRWVWIDENTLDVLTSNKKKKAVQALSLGIDHDFTPKEIACLPKLKFLEGEGLDFVGDFKNLLHSLIWLSWYDCPLNFLATNLHLVNLVVLNLSRSKITDDWGGWRQIKMAKKLKILDLTQCYKLTKTPDLSMFRMLEKLILAGCKNLSTIDSSIGKLKLLSTLNINKCASLKGLPEEIGSLECLSEIIIPSSDNQFKFPETLGNLKSLTKFAIQMHGGINQLPCSIGRLNITHLVLTFCYCLHELPDSIGELESLIKLDLCGSAISILPYSIGRLTSLTHLNLSRCKNLHELPNSIGELESLVELDLRLSKISILPNSIGRLKNLKHLLLEGCSNLHELPNSIGELKALVELDLEYSWISFLPDSVKNLKRLKVLKMARTKIRTIPSALGGVETLEELDASFCRHLTDEIPWEMWSLTRLSILNLYETPISTVPKKISGFSSLQMLVVTSYRLCLLPELPSSLKCLVVKAAYFPVLPNLSNLVHLDHLEVCRTHAIITFWSANEVISPWKDARSIHQLARSLSTLILGWIPQLPDFSNFKSLVVLSISGCPLPHFPVLKYLERLRELMISSCELLESTPDLSCLKSLQKLELGAIIKLAEIPGLGEVESLKFLHITMCNMIKQLPNLSKLKNLQSLELEHCEKLRAIEGLKELNSLKKVEIKHCMSLERLPDVPASTKLETNWMPPEAAEHIIQSTMLGKRLRRWEFWDE